MEELKEKVPQYAYYGAIGTGLFFFIQYLSYSYGFWFGTHCIAGSNVCPTSVTGEHYSPGQFTSCFFTIFIGSFNFMQIVPNITAILNGMKAGKRLYKVIDQKSTIDSEENKEVGLKRVKKGFNIEFENVTFSYPSRKHEKVLNRLNLVIQEGEVHALVGDTGSGKSTVVQLIMRFYDPDEGNILLDGVNIK